MKREPWLDEAFAGLGLPGAPADLRRRSLEAARRTPAQTTVLDFWTRVWMSRTARWAWASAVTVLLLANVALPLHPTTPSVDSKTSYFVIAGLLSDSDLAELVDLHPVRPDRLPMVGSDGEPRPTLADLDPDRS